MGKIVQVRDVDPAVEERLRAQAKAEGLSLSAYLRRELARLAERVEFEDRWGDYVRTGPGLDPDEIVDTIREMRGPLP